MKFYKPNLYTPIYQVFALESREKVAKYSNDLSDLSENIFESSIGCYTKIELS